MDLSLARLQDILCKHKQRYVGTQLTFSFEQKRIMIESSMLASARMTLSRLWATHDQRARALIETVDHGR